MLKRVIVGLLAFVVLLALVVVVRFYVLSPRMRPALEVKALATPEALARGKYLVGSVAGCLGCHSEIDEAISGEPPKASRLGSGRDFGLLPGFPGHVRAPNLTPV